MTLRCVIVSRASIMRRAGSTIHGSIVLGLEFARGTYTSPLGQPKAKAAL